MLRIYFAVADRRALPVLKVSARPRVVLGHNDECKQDHTFKIKSYTLCNQPLPVGSSVAVEF